MNGLIISNMMVSVPDYNAYADNVLGPQLDPDTLAVIKAHEAAGDFDNPGYLNTITNNYYPRHVLRLPLAEWPEPVLRGFDQLNDQIYVGMQGPSEFGIRGDASLLYLSQSGLGIYHLPSRHLTSLKSLANTQVLPTFFASSGTTLASR